MHYLKVGFAKICVRRFSEFVEIMRGISINSKNLRALVQLLPTFLTGNLLDIVKNIKIIQSFATSDKVMRLLCQAKQKTRKNAPWSQNRESAQYFAVLQQVIIFCARLSQQLSRVPSSAKVNK